MKNLLLLMLFALAGMSLAPASSMGSVSVEVSSDVSSSSRSSVTNSVSVKSSSDEDETRSIDVVSEQSDAEGASELDVSVSGDDATISVTENGEKIFQVDEGQVQFLSSPVPTPPSQKSTASETDPVSELESQPIVKFLRTLTPSESVVTVELQSENNIGTYEITTQRRERVFWLVPVTITRTYEVSSDGSGHTQSPSPLRQRLLDLISW